MTNRKLHMNFRLVPNSVTLEDRCLISPNSVAFRTDYVKMVGDTPILLRRKCKPKHPVFSDISLTEILVADHP